MRPQWSHDKHYFLVYTHHLLIYLVPGWTPFCFQYCLNSPPEGRRYVISYIFLSVCYRPSLHNISFSNFLWWQINITLWADLVLWKLSKGHTKMWKSVKMYIYILKFCFPYQSLGGISTSLGWGLNFMFCARGQRWPRDISYERAWKELCNILFLTHCFKILQWFHNWVMSLYCNKNRLTSACCKGNVTKYQHFSKALSLGGSCAFFMI